MDLCRRCANVDRKKSRKSFRNQVSGTQVFLETKVLVSLCCSPVTSYSSFVLQPCHFIFYICVAALSLHILYLCCSPVTSHSSFDTFERFISYTDESWSTFRDEIGICIMKD